MAKVQYFAFTERQKQFDLAFKELIEKLSYAERKKILATENEFRYTHGTKWADFSENTEEEMKLQQTSTEVSTLEIRNHNLSTLPSFINSILEGMTNLFKKMIYKTVLEACDKSGQVAKKTMNESPADAFLKALKMIEFGVDRDGKVSKPQIHMGSAAYTAFLKDLETKDKTFHDEVEKVSKEKEIKALEKEASRLNKFKRK